jgi:hypothetical protein
MKTANIAESGLMLEGAVRIWNCQVDQIHRDIIAARDEMFAR